MKCLATVVLLLYAHLIGAQQIVQTLVPQQPVTVGEAFQVQFVVYELEHFQNLKTPDFGAQFKVVSGPAVYSGNISKGGRNIAVQNFSYTLIPLQKGLLTVAGATAIYTNKQIDAPSVFISSNAKSANSAANPQTPQPTIAGKDALIVKAEIGKKECYVGEPVTATFTLLSKVVTASEVIKNPGFYGFSVVEMPADITAIEGTYTGGYERYPLRKVQLYPMQAGKLVVDEMTVHNLVQTIDAVGNVVEKEWILESTPQYINVKPLPAAPIQNFTGAVGRFAIKAKLKNEKLMVGRTGRLLLTVSGAGNFLQLPIPDIAWPQHIEGFEPHIIEQLRKDAVPMAGRKQYEYSFTADSAGNYSIPPVLFSYFDPQTKNYHTVATDSLHLTVIPQKDLGTFFKKNEKGSGSSSYFWWMIAGVVVVLFLGMFWLARRRKEKKLAPLVNRPLHEEKIDYVQQLQNLSPPQKDFKTFYTKLQQLLLLFLKEEHHLYANTSGTVVQQLAHAPFTQKQKETLQEILEECERVQYYNAVPHVPFTELHKKAVDVVSQLQKST